MKVEAAYIPEVKIITQFSATDRRGVFVKPFHQQDMQAAGLHFTMKESFYSVSKKDVIRGMHFHSPPYDHEKIVFCTRGAILDVALDLRKNSATYGQYVTEELSLENSKALLIPRGFAHGFLSLTENATAFYFVSGEYNAKADGGVLYDSFGFGWPVSAPVLSDRDLQFVSFSEFDSPFNL